MYLLSYHCPFDDCEKFYFTNSRSLLWKRVYEICDFGFWFATAGYMEDGLFFPLANLGRSATYQGV